jgi:FAD/FMN-containing dehydrogenase
MGSDQPLVTRVQPAAWDLLRRSLQGELLLPGDGRYDKARQVYYRQYDVVSPQAVARCASAADVAACLAFCHDNGLPATPRSGGHSLAGYSTGPGLVINTSRLNRVAVEDTTVTIGPGARQVDTLVGLARHGLAMPNGLCPTVCAGGFLTGGGFGWSTRRHGMGCDQLVSAEVVLADGRVTRCSATKEPDLFWALRGGGGGNFGVITEYELRPQRASTLVNYMLTWPWDAAPAVLPAWQRWIIDGPDELGSALGVPLADAAPGTAASVMVNGGWLGDAAAMRRELDAFIAEVGQPPETRTVEELPYLDAMLQWYDCVDKSDEQRQWTGQAPEALIPRQSYFVDRSRMIEHEIPASGVEELLTAFDAARRAGQVRFLSLFALGGQANRVPRTATAYAHRTTRFYLGYSVGLADAIPNDEDRLAAHAWADTGFAVADKYSNGESYQNFIDPELPDWRSAYYAENYSRLVEVKRQYDPHGFFRFAQSIG